MGIYEDEYAKEFHSGNRFFEHKYPSIRIAEAIDRMNSFDEFESFYTTDLMEENLLLGKYLKHLLDERKLNPTEVSRGIGKHESYVGKIAAGTVPNPARDVLLAICVFIGATVEETQILLRYSGKQPLYARRKRDAIVWFALKKRPLHERQDAKLYLENLNGFLESQNYDSLSKVIIKSERKKKEEK